MCICRYARPRDLPSHDPNLLSFVTEKFAKSSKGYNPNERLTVKTLNRK